MKHECTYCTARHWIEEAGSDGDFELCCKKGDAILEYLRPPPPVLRGLLDGTDPRSRHFRQHIRSYNSALAFTSVNATRDDRVDLRRGVQAFSIHGELYHLQGPLVPSSQEPPAFAQLFFYDPEYATDLRAGRNPRLNRTILQDLHEMLLEVRNPFIGLYKTARERLRTQEGNFRMVISPQMKLVVQAGADRRRENLPVADELAGIIPDEYEDIESRDVILAVREPGRNGPLLHRVPVTNAAYMPLHYVLLFPYGEHGWHWSIELANRRRHRQNLRFAQQPFYRFRLHERLREQSVLFFANRLFQQYVVDAYVACETTRLDWLRTHQDNIRADVYNGVADHLYLDDGLEGRDLGYRTVLPSSFTGSDRFMQQRFQDSMAIVRHFGKPTLFITFTANPNWPEVVAELKDDQHPIDRPDLIARVFRLKKKQLLADIRNGLFGKRIAHVYTIEYQKRGLPHMHLLIFMHDSADYLEIARIDEIVSAELPDAVTDPTGQLRDLILTQMVHGPCGPDFPDAPCMARKHPGAPLRCQKRFPKPFCERTKVNEDGYPDYCRRDNGQTFTVRKNGRDVVLDNRWVVPHNPYLLTKYRAHINVEICGSVQAVKYINKYVYKGTDRTTLAVNNSDDEITRYVQARYVSPPEAVWRLFEFKTHEEYPSVVQLAVHLKGQQTVYFKPHLTAAELAEKLDNSGSTLTGYFEYNMEHPDDPPYLYSEFPAHYVWNKRIRKWTRRQKGEAIGRMYHCSPISGDRFYLRLLLTVVRQAKSFEELFDFEGVTYATYKGACIARGLTEDDKEWYHCFDEAILFASARSLRTLFLTGLRQRETADPQAIWEKYKVHFCDDLAYKLSRESGFPLPLLNPHFDYGLFLLAEGLADQQQTLADHNLPANVWDWTRAHQQWAARGEIEDLTAKARIMIDQLNPDQQAAFTEITTAIATDPQTAHFYAQGQGGSGKTFLYKTLCYHYRGQGKIVLCVASTGIAALLLPGGCTSHSQFKIPIDLYQWSVSSVSKQSKLADLLRIVDLIIWDEVPMQHKFCFEVVHRLLTDLRGTTDGVLFGGVPVILGGDFAQILPVVVNGSRADIVSACLQRSFIWPRLKRISLRINMRVREGAYGPEFVNWVSNMPYDPEQEHSVKIPDYVNQPVEVVGLIDHVYPQEVMARAVREPGVFAGRCLLSTLNTTVTELNKQILGRLPGVIRTYSSVDTHVTEEGAENALHQYPVELLQKIDVASLPPSQLFLKIGTPLLLLRNLNQREGLCNGSRMVVTALRAHCLEVRLLGGDFDGQLRVIPRIKLKGDDKDLGIELTRKQFPVRLCFAMTINKSQGQSFHTIGLDLRIPVFTHGQLYVGISRTSSVAGLGILLPVENTGRTPNVVYPEVLLDIQ